MNLQLVFDKLSGHLPKQATNESALASKSARNPEDNKAAKISLQPQEQESLPKDKKLAKKPAKATESKKTVSKQKPTPRRIVRRTSLKSYQAAARLWQIILLSLPFDLLFGYFLQSYPVVGRESKPILETLTLITLAIAVSGMFRRSTLNAYLKLNYFRSRLMQLQQNKMSLLIIGLMGLVFITETAARMVSHGSIGAIITMLVIMFGVFSFARENIEFKTKQHLLFRDPIFWIEKANVEILWIVSIPIVAARLVSFFGVAAFSHAESSVLGFLPYFLGSLIILLDLYPTKSLFMAPCKRCHFTTSVALNKIGFCPACDYEKFVLKELVEEKKIAPNSNPSLPLTKPLEDSSQSSSGAWGNIRSKIKLRMSNLTAKVIDNKNIGGKRSTASP